MLIKKIKNILAKNNIDFIHGKPYYPHSQGAVERNYLTVRTGLIFKYIEDKKNFDINKSLINVVSSYNNCVHDKTKYKPNDVFFQKKDLFIKVYENTFHSIKNYNVNNLLYNKYNYVLIINNFTSTFIIKRNLLLLEKSKIKRKNCLFNICGTIINNENNGNLRNFIRKKLWEL